MIPYTSHPHYSMSMSQDDLLVNSLALEVQKSRINYILESGTFRGTGSTLTLSKIFEKIEPPIKFVTLEANWRNWRTAKFNLRKYPFVECIWGLTVPIPEAIAFIEGDNVLNNHNYYDNIYIDAIDNPLEFYKNEISGKLKYSEYKYLNYLISIIAFIEKPFRFQGDNLLRKYLLDFKNSKPLILLDSAGGIGFLEFNIVNHILNDKPFFIILDDIHHVKHFRSYEFIRDSNDYKIIDVNEENGWVFAKHLID